MRAARSVAQPVSVVRGHRRPGRKWTPRDRLLLLALQAYEDDLCPGCGTPRTYSMDPDAAGRFRDATVTCHGCATSQRAQDAQPKPPPGTYRTVTPDEGLTHAMHYPIHVPPLNS